MNPKKSLADRLLENDPVVGSDGRDYHSLGAEENNKVAQFMMGQIERYGWEQATAFNPDVIAFLREAGMEIPAEVESRVSGF